MKKQIVAALLSCCLAFAQAAKPASAPVTATPKPVTAAPKPVAPAPKPVAAAPATAKPTVAKPTAVAARPASAVSSGIDTVIQLVKGGMSEGMIVRTLKATAKVYALSPQDMLKLTQAGVSENIMSVMMDPKADVAAATAAPVPVAPTPTPEPTPVVSVSAPTAASKVEKRRLAITPFDYSTVKSWVTFWFGNDTNIGQGIRAMLTTRVAKLGTIRLLEREKVDSIMKEQDLGATARVNQASKAKIGKVLGADAILYGDITIFGRDDVKKKTGVWGGISKIGLGLDFGKLNKEEKAVVGIAYRIVDAETGEILDTGEARGESSRKSKDWGGFVAGNKAAGGIQGGMESSNFEQTIIGEATMDACAKLAEEISKKVATLPIKARTIDAMIASVQGDKIYINYGTNEGVQVGDKFEVHQITGIVKDPDTKEVLDKTTVRVGDLSIVQVRDKISIGTYSGPPLSQAQLKGDGYAARKNQ